MNLAKYVVILSGQTEMLFTFPNDIAHNHMFDAVTMVKEGLPLNWTRPHRLAKIVSAGFINNAGECGGKSESLGIESRGTADTALFRAGGQRDVS